MQGRAGQGSLDGVSEEEYDGKVVDGRRGRGRGGFLGFANEWAAGRETRKDRQLQASRMLKGV